MRRDPHMNAGDPDAARPIEDGSAIASLELRTTSLPDAPHDSNDRGTSGQPTEELTWQHVVTAVAAAAGGAAWVSAIGSGVVALRLRQADLPVEPVVALMSAEHRFAIGAGILIAPLLAALVGFLADLAPVTRRTPRRRRRLAAATTAAGAALIYLLLKPQRETFIIECIAVAGVVPFALHFLRHRDWFHERVGVFLLVLVAAGAGAICAESVGSPSFDETAIRILKPSGSLVTGAYITTTEHSVVLSPGCGVVMAVPRDQIARITVGPGNQRRTKCAGP